MKDSHAFFEIMAQSIFAAMTLAGSLLLIYGAYQFLSLLLPALVDAAMPF